jgi:hypothetical protein
MDGAAPQALARMIDGVGLNAGLVIGGTLVLMLVTLIKNATSGRHYR